MLCMRRSSFWRLPMLCGLQHARRMRFRAPPPRAAGDDVDWDGWLGSDSTRFCAVLTPAVALANKGKTINLPCRSGGETRRATLVWRGSCSCSCKEQAKASKSLRHKPNRPAYASKAAAGPSES